MSQYGNNGSSSEYGNSPASSQPGPSSKLFQRLQNALGSLRSANELISALYQELPSQMQLSSGQLLVGQSSGQGLASNGSSDGLDAVRLLRVTYDKSVQGGAVGNITLPGPSLPAKAIIKQSWLDVIIAPVGAGASVAIAVTNLGSPDILPATVVASLGVGIHGGTQDGTPGNMEKNGSSALPVVVEISGAPLTAGKMVIFLEYVVSQ